MLHLAKYLSKDLSNIKKINLSDCSISEKGMVKLIMSIKESHQLKSLNLSRNNFGNDKIVRRLVKAYFNQTLEELYLDKCNLKSAGFTSFADSIMRNNCLKVLSLRSNDIDDAGAKHFDNILRR